jgi:hypothetical protein
MDAVRRLPRSYSLGVSVIGRWIRRSRVAIIWVSTLLTAYPCSTSGVTQRRVGEEVCLAR